MKYGYRTLLLTTLFQSRLTWLTHVHQTTKTTTGTTALGIAGTTGTTIASTTLGNNIHHAKKTPPVGITASAKYVVCLGTVHTCSLRCSNPVATSTPLLAITPHRRCHGNLSRTWLRRHTIQIIGSSIVARHIILQPTWIITSTNLTTEEKRLSSQMAQVFQSHILVPPLITKILKGFLTFFVI